MMVIDSVKNSAEQREMPPHYKDYKRAAKCVYVSPYHGANEVDDNVRVAALTAKKIKDKVWLLPRLDRKTKLSVYCVIPL